VKQPAWLSIVLLAVVAVRVGGIVISAVSHTRGDYYMSMPGAYVRTVNPVLWESPDLQAAMGYHHDTYFHGPVQYLTLYPVAYLDSYEQIARVLLPIYALVIAAAIWCLLGGLRALAPDVPFTVPVIAATLLFFPLLQAFLQREFEVVMLLGLAAAFGFTIVNRQAAAGGLLAWIAWYKYMPLLFAGYLVLRGWTTALAAFVVTSLAILLAAHTLFGLPLFFNNIVPNQAAWLLAVGHYEFRPDAAGALIGFGFCDAWRANETANAGLRHGLCSIAARQPWLAPNVAYLVICTAVALTYLWAYRRFARDRSISPERERWRRAVEFSIVTTICTCFFFTHFYYLAALIVPLSVLLVRYLSRHDYRSLAMWAVCYTLISAFVVPSRLLNLVLGIDSYRRYIEDSWFLWGELLLVGLLLREYVALSGVRDDAYVGVRVANS
jgi:hypothetical protein